MRGTSILMLVAAFVFSGSIWAQPPHDPGHDTSSTTEGGRLTGPERDSVSTHVLDEPRIIDAFRDLSDPKTLEVDPATGLLYRHATAAELVDNGWEPGTFLVEDSAPDRLGASVRRLLVPLPGAAPVHFEMLLADVRSDIVHIESRAAGGATSVTTPRHYLYSAPGRVAGATDELPSMARLVVSERGGYAGDVLIRDVLAEVTGPEGWWRIDPVPPPVGYGIPTRFALVKLTSVEGHIPPLRWSDVPSSPEPATHCGFFQFFCDFFPDFAFGLPDVNHNFALMGEMKWCTQHAANWDALMKMTASDIEGTYQNTSGLRAQMNHEISSCWFGRDQDFARACALGIPGTHCTDREGHAYSYFGCNTDASCYRDTVWSDVFHAKQHGSFDALKVAQAIHEGPMDFNGILCGKASLPENSDEFHPDPTASGPLPTGDSVSVGRPAPAGCLAFTSAHEIGHNFDARHEQAVFDNNCWTIMRNPAPPEPRQPRCDPPLFSASNSDTINACIGNDKCPRSGAD